MLSKGTWNFLWVISGNIWVAEIGFTFREKSALEFGVKLRLVLIELEVF